MTSQQPLIAIPTHVFMGFLGSGKTSAILSLFENKPTNERWAVLVNEYGKLGIDGAHYQSQGVTVKEIPGGCMCCAAGVPMQVAVNQLLRQSRPDRLFIETSGLGHPIGVLKTLNSTHFKSVLLLKASVCFLDPEKLLNPALSNNELFQQQVSLADILVANKTDLASMQAMTQFDVLKNSFLIQKSIISKTTFGVIDPQWLTLDPIAGREKDLVGAPLPASKEKSAFFVSSQTFGGERTFSLERLKQLFKHNRPVRIKAICRTESGWVLLNGEGERITIKPVQQQTQSRFDIILDNEEAQQVIDAELVTCSKSI